jgi:V/A-type H+-transporting ATPase subunit D
VATIQVSATRMELLRVRRRLGIAVRGHALLKDKLEGLMQEFMKLIKAYKAGRRAFDAEFPQVMGLFALASLTGSRRAVEAALAQSRAELELTLERRNLAGVNVPHFTARIRPGAGYSLLETPVELDEAIAALRAYFPKVLELAEMEHSVWLLVAEVERTRRRVNALEYIMIPALREALRYIKAKLDENERANTVRLMKIKEMRLAQQRKEMAHERPQPSS